MHGEVSISSAGYATTVTTHGATERCLTAAGRDLIAPFPRGARRPEMRGALLAPWPGRTSGARYTYDGTEHVLPTNEPGRNAALHGFAAWTEFDIVTHEPDRVVMAGEILPGRGYPWRLDLVVDVAVDNAGLTHVITATNVGTGTAPVGLGFHPYLLAGEMRAGAADAWTMSLQAGHVLALTGRALDPGPLAPFEPAAVRDDRGGQSLEGVRLNHAYTTLERDDDGWSRVRLTGDGGAGVELAVDRGYPWIHVYTADEAPAPDRRASVAVEPTTCPPDAFNSGRDLVRLGRGESLSAACRVRALS